VRAFALFRQFTISGAWKPGSAAALFPKARSNAGELRDGVLTLGHSMQLQSVSSKPRGEANPNANMSNETSDRIQATM
jgi:hypothetical protein